MKMLAGVSFSTNSDAMGAENCKNATSCIVPSRGLEARHGHRTRQWIGN
jgi:hypothetical protein